MANVASLQYPTLVPTAPVGNGVGLPNAKNMVPAAGLFSDRSIRGAIKVNPANAPAMVETRWRLQSPRNNAVSTPLETKSKVTAQAQATRQGPNAWKKQTLPAMSDAVLWGGGKPQKPVAVPWIKKFIPPLALFNDASQWVNRLMFNQPLPWFGAATSDPPLKAQYFTPRPIMVSNYAAGTLNAQLQLGNIAIQAQQLTISASTYFGGS
jgi:hypothetical protein